MSMYAIIYVGLLSWYLVGIIGSLLGSKINGNWSIEMFFLYALLGPLNLIGSLIYYFTFLE